MSIYSSSVKRPITTALVFVAVMVIGLFSLSRLSIDLYPSIDMNTIFVMTSYSGASASDIEMNVTKPMENQLNTIADLKHITSQSKENISIVSLEFKYGIDLSEATNDVRDKIERVKSYLPDDADTPIIFKFGTDDIPIIMLSVQAKESLPALYKILEDRVANPIQRISGVGAVSISGAPSREIQVYCDPQKLEAYNISIEYIASVIASENKNVPGGSIDIGSNTYSLRVQGEFTDAFQLNNIVLANNGDKIIYLKDVATVTDTVQERAQESYTDGIRGGMIIIQKQAGANSVDIAKKVHAILPELQASLPSDVTLGVIVDTSTNIENTIGTLVETVMFTFIIVMLVVLVFLGRWRATFIIVLTIPISLIASFIYLLISGNTLNIISLSSLSIAIGMVVDDAIVVLENITTHIERGSKPKQAAVYATNEVAISVIASTLVLLCVFMPMVTIGGMSGIMFRQLGWVVSIVMIVSLAVALTLTPMLGSVMLKQDPKKGKVFQTIFGPIEKGLDALDRGYARLLGWAVRHRTTVIVGALAIFGSSLFLVRFIGTEFYPASDNARIGVTLELPVGTRMEISKDLAFRIDEQWRVKYPEIRVMNFTVGQAESSNTFASLQSNGSNIISFNINLVSVGKRDRGMLEICEMMRQDLKQYPELKTYRVNAGGGMSGMGSQSSVNVEIYGFDFNTTDAIAQEMAGRLRELKSAAQVTVSREDYVPEYQVDFDREKLAVNGLNISTAASYLRNRINGMTASYYREDGDEYDIRIRYNQQNRQSLGNIEDILIYNPQGKGIRIKDLGTVVERFVPPTIERKDRERVITVSGVVKAGVPLSDMVKDIQGEVSKMDIPSNVSIILGGTYETQQESFNDLTMLMAIIIILVFIVLASQFESFTYPFIIMFSLPFAFTGVFIGLAATGTPLSIMALIGLIMLMGIVVKNGIVLIDYTILCRERGQSVTLAAITAGKSRLRPVLMTTLTTVFGMLPMALGTGEGSETWRPMGMTVAWGLSFSTLITLVLIPVLYCVFAGTGLKRKRRKHNAVSSIAE